MQFSALALLMSLVSSAGWSAGCVSDMSEFDFNDMSPQKFHFGTREEVSGAYELLIEAVGDPKWYDRPTLFYVTGGFTQFTKAECAGDKCRGMDILTGLQQCAFGAQSGADACHPIAAVYQSRMYCLLEPSLEEFDYDNPFVPFQ